MELPSHTHGGISATIATCVSIESFGYITSIDKRALAESEFKNFLKDGTYIAQIAQRNVLKCFFAPIKLFCAVSFICLLIIIKTIVTF